MLPYRFVVCTSRISSGQRELEQMVHDLGGRTTSEFSLEVSHLVAAAPNSSKCCLAAEACIPIVQEKWVRASWMLWKDKNGPSLTPEARDKIPLAPIGDHQLPVLRFQCISVTGAGFTDRQELERRIEALGGKYSGQLDKNKTTMLLCDVRTASGNKLNAALDWGIPTITVDWLNAVEQRGAWKKFEPYYVDAYLQKHGINKDRYQLSQSQSQSQTNNGRRTNRGPSSSSSFSNSSSLHVVPNSIDSSLLVIPSSNPQQHAELPKQRAMSAPPNIPQTTATDFASSTRVSSRASVGVPSVTATSSSFATSNSSENSSEPQSKQFVLALQEFVQARKKICNGFHYGLEEASEAMCLDGCRVSSHGFPNSVHALVQRCLRMALRNTGAIFVEDLQNVRATHIIVPDNYVHVSGSGNGSSKGRGERLRTNYVHLSWLTKSIEKGKCETPTSHAAKTVSKFSATSAQIGSSTHSNTTLNTTLKTTSSSSSSLSRSNSISISISNSNNGKNGTNGTTGRSHQDERNKRKRDSSSSGTSNAQQSSSVAAAPVLPLKGLIVCVTGFRDRGLKNIEKIAVRLGAEFTQYLGRNCSYLVCKKPEGAKYMKACSWPKIEIVTLHWLQECERTQTKILFDNRKNRKGGSNQISKYRFDKELQQPKRKKRKKKIGETAPTASSTSDEMNPTQSKKNSNKRNSQRDSQKNSQKNSQRNSQRNSQKSSQRNSQRNSQSSSQSSINCI